MIHDRSNHFAQDVCANEADRVLKDNDTHVQELVHHERENRIVMVKVRISEAESAITDLWVQVVVLVDPEAELEFKRQVLED